MDLYDFYEFFFCPSPLKEYGREGMHQAGAHQVGAWGEAPSRCMAHGALQVVTNCNIGNIRAGLVSDVYEGSNIANPIIGESNHHEKSN